MSNKITDKIKKIFCHILAILLPIAVLIFFVNILPRSFGPTIVVIAIVATIVHFLEK